MARRRSNSLSSVAEGVISQASRGSAQYFKEWSRRRNEHFSISTDLE